MGPFWVKAPHQPIEKAFAPIVPLVERLAKKPIGCEFGAGLGSEEWPFISADASVVFEPGMVMAFGDIEANETGASIVKVAAAQATGQVRFPAVPVQLLDLAIRGWRLQNYHFAEH